MAKLAAVLDSLDGVAEPLREFYQEQDGKYVLDADVEAHPSTEQLRQTAKARKSERESVERTLKEFRDLGMTPEEIRELKGKLTEPPGPGEPKDFEKLVAKRVDEVKKEFEPVVAENDRLKGELKQLRLTDRVRADYIAAGGIEEDAELVLKDTDGRFDLSDKNKVVVLDDDGDPTGMTPKEWFEKKYKPTRKKFFKGTGAAGSGAAGGSGGSDASDDLAKLPPAERLNRARELGLK